MAYLLDAIVKSSVHSRLTAVSTGHRSNPQLYIVQLVLFRLYSGDDPGHRSTGGVATCRRSHTSKRRQEIDISNANNVSNRSSSSSRSTELSMSKAASRLPPSLRLCGFLCLRIGMFACRLNIDWLQQLAARPTTRMTSLRHHGSACRPGIHNHSGHVTY